MLIRRPTYAARTHCGACLSALRRLPHTPFEPAAGALVLTPTRRVSAVSSTPPFALTSPPHLMETVFVPVESSDAAPTDAVVLHTTYLQPDTAKETPPSSSSSSCASSSCAATAFAVRDVQAFEDLIHKALHVTPVAATHAAAESLSLDRDGAEGHPSPPAMLRTNHTIRELQALLAAAELAVEKPAARKAAVDIYVQRAYLPLLKYGTFALLSIQFVVYFNWIFFVFDWNLVEPTTYFLGYTGVFCSLVYHYYRCGEDGYSWKNLFQHLAHREAGKMYAAKKVDAAAVARLERRIADIKAELARVSA